MHPRPATLSILSTRHSASGVTRCAAACLCAGIFGTPPLLAVVWASARVSRAWSSSSRAAAPTSLPGYLRRSWSIFGAVATSGGQVLVAFRASPWQNRHHQVETSCSRRRAYARKRRQLSPPAAPALCGFVGFGAPSLWDGKARSASRFSPLAARVDIIDFARLVAHPAPRHRSPAEHAVHHVEILSF